MSGMFDLGGDGLSRCSLRVQDADPNDLPYRDVCDIIEAWGKYLDEHRQTEDLTFEASSGLRYSLLNPTIDECYRNIRTIRVLPAQPAQPIKVKFTYTPTRADRRLADDQRRWWRRLFD